MNDTIRDSRAELRAFLDGELARLAAQGLEGDEWYVLLKFVEDLLDCHERYPGFDVRHELPPVA
jgi:hypothetical protein